jgi:hypothetical protein
MIVYLRETDHNRVGIIKQILSISHRQLARGIMLERGL